MQANYTPLFTYIIPFRFRPDKMIPLRRVLDWLSGFQGVEILIVEQDKHSKISHMNLKAKHIFIENEGEFNKSWAYNVGLKRSQSPVVICGEADFIMNPNDLIFSLNTLQNFDCVLPISKVTNLNPGESNMDFNSIFSVKNNMPTFVSTNGISLFKKDALNRIAGWNEDFIGSVYENRFQEMKVTKLLNTKKLDLIGYHFFHQSSMPSFQFDQRNKQIFEHYSDADVNKLQNHINIVASKVGHANKFCGI
jgi:glycosyltransferase involved in cell wall biosynthesis